MKRSFLPDVYRGLAVGALAVGLTACSGAPSTQDAEAAVIAEYQRMLGARTGATANGFSLDHCEKSSSAEAPGYFCDVAGTVVVDVQGTSMSRSLKGRYRFVQADGQWQVFPR
ncbi:hypothetical protein [Lysobacter enzymogenes]|uniref:hypothetical protein n=1 Tax=Lysobacter enzymogenes TaxID=69 RepID=UPI00099BF54F|nr:hypothetical protein [Lysobacter enzymogenes]UZW62848.1 hypothetical protein BV903_011355 [Lysobacter enzymogenes]